MDLKMFYMRLFLNEPLNRDFFAIPPVNFLHSFKIYLTYGFYHVFSAHQFVLLFTFIVFCLELFFEIKATFKSGEQKFKYFINNISAEMKIIIISTFFAVCFSLIAALSDAKKMEFIGKIIKSLKGFSFTRLYVFNQILWYIAFAAALILFQKIIRFKQKILIVYAILSLQVLYICTCRTSYNDSALNWYCKLRNLSTDGSITYKEFFAEDLFNTIKDEINYNNEPVIAVGYHPSVLLYNGFNTIDGYISMYPYSDMLRFRKLIQPELEQNEEERNYYDIWGGRRYIYNSELSYQPTRFSCSKRITLRIDETSFKNDFRGKYIFSRAELSNADELGFKFKKSFLRLESIYKIWVYEVE